MMTADATLVNALGMFAGTVWLCAALWLQLVETRRVHPGLVSALALIGVALMMASSAIVVDNRSTTLLAGAANLVFIVLGIVSWYAVERHAELQEAKAAHHRTDPE